MRQPSLKTLFTGLVIVSVGFSLMGNARAQEKKTDEPDLQIVCADIPDIIIPLKTPQFDQSVPYKNLNGIIGEDRFIVAAPVGKDKLLIVGESWPYDTRVKKTGDRHLLFATMDVKGNVSDEHRVVFKTEGRFLKGFGVSATEFALLSIANEGGKPAKSAMVFTSADGKKVSVKPLAIQGYEGINVTDIIRNPKNGSFIALADLTETAGAQSSSAAVIYLDRAGNVTSHRKFTSGIASKLHGLTALKGGGYVAVGEIALRAGNRSAWMVHLNDSGAILSQTPYLRGAEAKLVRALPLKDGKMLLAGNVTGAKTLEGKEEGEAGWLMMISASGQTIWQRYLTGIFAFDAVQLEELEDGRLVMLANARPNDENVGKRHARQLTFAPNGYLLDDIAYYDGTATVLNSALLSRKPEDVSLLIGQAQTGFVSYKQPLEVRRASFDAWLSGTVTYPAWENPCLKP